MAEKSKNPIFSKHHQMSRNVIKWWRMHPNVVFEPPFGLSGSLWRHQARQTGVVRLQVLVLEMAQGPSPTPITAGGFISNHHYEPIHVDQCREKLIKNIYR